MEIQACKCDIVHRKGKANRNADALSPCVYPDEQSMSESDSTASMKSYSGHGTCG